MTCYASRHMRATVTSSLAFACAVAPLVAACSADAGGAPPPASVHELLATDGAALAVSGTTSTGAVVARLWRTGWRDDRVELGIGDGELVLSTNAAGDVVVEDLGFALAPIELPADATGESTRLVDLRLELAADAPAATTTWTDDNAALAATTVALQLSWSLETGDRVTPLGRVTLAALPLELTLAGTPTHVEAGLALRSDGVVWSWADLIELADLSLAITATSAE